MLDLKHLKKHITRCIMGIISWADIRRGILAIFLVIFPTLFLSVYLTPNLVTYHLSESDLWELERKNSPAIVTEPLNEIILEKFLFKFRLMSKIESKISNPAIYKKYEKKIEDQISSSPIWAAEYSFLFILGSFYWILWFYTRRFFPEGEV